MRASPQPQAHLSTSFFHIILSPKQPPAASAFVLPQPIRPDAAAAGAYRPERRERGMLCVYGSRLWPCVTPAVRVALLAALATMSLTRQRQKTYYNLTVAEMRNETRLYFGEDWPESYRGLPEEVFEPEQPASLPASRTRESVNSND